MAKGVLIVGATGSGKSTSARNLNPKETFIINVQGKPLPFDDKKYVECEAGQPPAKGNLYYTDNVKTIKNVLQYISENRPEIKHVVIDDYQYAAVNEFMRRLQEKGFTKFNDIGFGIWSIPEMLPKLRRDLIVFFLSHEETYIDDNQNKFRRAKSMGKLIEQQVGGIEGYFTYVMFTEVSKDDNGINHNFVTNNEGDTTAKTPIGLFDMRIPNDLTIISKAII